MSLPDWTAEFLVNLNPEEKIEVFDRIFEKLLYTYDYHTKTGMKVAKSPPIPLSVSRHLLMETAFIVNGLRKKVKP